MLLPLLGMLKLLLSHYRSQGNYDILSCTAGNNIEVVLKGKKYNSLQIGFPSLYMLVDWCQIKCFLGIWTANYIGSNDACLSMYRQMTLASVFKINGIYKN